MLLLLGPGCGLRRVVREFEEIRHTAMISGRVRVEGPRAGTVYVLHFIESGEAKALADVDALPNEVAEYGFLVDPGGRHYVVAFEDLNGDKVWEPGEPVGALEDAVEVSARDQQALPELVLFRNGAPPEGVSVRVPAKRLDSPLPFARGELASLDDEAFSPAKSSEGLWAPLSSARMTGFGVYFLQPYDPAKTPVLFIHGINGSPRDFRELIAALDPARFQPWVVRYPSGIRLPMVVRGLDDGLLELRDRLHVKHLVMVAHSMGGLVARGAVLELGRRHEEAFVGGLITLSTPYDGHDMARRGLDRAPRAVPAWIDMAPGSDFLRSLHAPLPRSVPFYLLFGVGQRVPWILNNNDGTVEVASELAPWAQEDAAKTFGYDEGHVAILSSPQVIQRLTLLLRDLP